MRVLCSSRLVKSVYWALLLLMFVSQVFAGSFSAFSKTYHRSTGAPFVEVDSFVVKNPNTTYTLEIYNGGLTGSEFKRVSSSIIQVNGHQALGPSDFNQKVTYLSREVNLNAIDLNGDASVNQIAVELRGKPGGAIVINITGTDNEPPLITPHISPLANEAGWHQSDVHVTFTCSDTITEVTACPSAITLSTEGANQQISVSAMDGAGNEANLTLSLDIDKTAPTVLVSQTPPPNSAGWHNQTVTVSYTCQDNLSGIASCPGQVVEPAEGGHVLSGTVSDIAGNLTQIDSSISIDLTPPTVRSTQFPAPNTAGWNNMDTNVSFSCTDALSGVSDCSSPILVNTEGQAHQVQGHGQDHAGNTASITHTLNLDKTAPEITATQTPAPNPHGWVNQAVIIDFTCRDVLSGVSNCTDSISVNTPGASQQFNGSVTDHAGNTAQTSAIVSLDTTAPTITKTITPTANAQGWHAADVNVAYTCQDDLSGIDQCSAAESLTHEGMGIEIIGTATDKAANTASTQTMLNIDKTPPTITATTTPPANADGWHNSDVTVTFDCQDTLSGIAQCEETRIVNSEGQGLVIAGQASDNAGNTAALSPDLEINIDKTAPVVQVSSPSNGVSVTDAMLSVTGNVVEQNIKNLTINGTTITLTGDGSFSHEITLNEGINNIKVFASDLAGNSSSSSSAVTYIANRPPQIISQAAATAFVGTLYQYSVEGEDPDTGDSLDYSLINSPSGMSIDLKNGIIEWTPVASQIGQHDVTVRVTDQLGLVAEQSYTIEVTGPQNNTPVITSKPVLMSALNNEYRYQVVATDEDGDALTFALEDGPASAGIDASTGLMTWLPQTEGNYSFILCVDDGFGGVTKQSFSVMIVQEREPLSYMGTEFWFMFSNNDRTPHARDLDLSIYVSSLEDTIAIVEIPLLGYIETLLVEAGTSIRHELPLEIKNKLYYQYIGQWDGGIRVTTDKPSVVHILNQRRYSTDASLILPVDVLRKNYLVNAFGLKRSGVQVNALTDLSSFGIVATEDNTRVSIQPTVDMDHISVMEDANALPVVVGQTVEVLLNQGETLQAEAIGQYADLTGTSINADKPIALFGGNPCSFVPYYNTVACDHLVEQTIPLDSWGVEYLTVPLATRKLGDTFTVLASRDDTEVYINGVLTFRLNAGEHDMIVLNGANRITANQPVLVTQFSNGGGFDSHVRDDLTLGSDPFMVAVPTTGQFLKDYIVTAVDSKVFRAHFLNLIVPESVVDKVTLDGNPLDEVTRLSIPYSNYVGIQLEVTAGHHHISAPLPFGVYGYGFGDWDSYGYLGGMSLTRDEAALEIFVNYEREGDTAGEELCLNISALGVSNLPLTQTQVHINVTGANPHSISHLTDSTGFANYCYYGAKSGIDTVVVSVKGQSKVADFEWLEAVPGNNHRPYITSLPHLTAALNQVYTYQIHAVDPDNDNLNYVLDYAPSGMSVSETGLVTWSVPDDFESSLVTIRVNDTLGESDIQQFKLRKEFINNYPVKIISTPPTVSIVSGHRYEYEIQYSDGDVYEPDYYLISAPEGLTVGRNARVGKVLWTPTSEQVGEHSVEIMLSDRRGSTDKQTFTINVIPNQPPIVYSTPPSVASVGYTAIHKIIAEDPEGDTLGAYIVPNRAGINVDNVTLTVSLTPDGIYFPIGQNNLKLYVYDNAGGVTIQNFPIYVYNNKGPVITSSPSTFVALGVDYSYQISATDPEGDSLNYRLAEAPTGMSISATGLVSWAGVDHIIGDHSVDIYVDDGKGAYYTQKFTLTVAQNRTPQITSRPLTEAEVNKAYSYSVLASDPDGDILSYVLAQSPQGMVITQTGEITWQPSVDQLGNHTIQVNVSDGDFTEIQSFTLSVLPENLPPVVTIDNYSYEAIITSPSEIIATIDDTNITTWRLAYRAMYDMSAQWQDIATGTTSVMNAAIGTFDPTQLISGQYKLLLTATDSAGQESQDLLQIYVEGNLKVGNFSFTVEDMNIPVSGIPIRVTRTYDSRRRHQALDFGYGWSVGYQDVILSESRPVGLFWSLNEYRGGAFNSEITYCVEPQGAPTVTITLPKGDTETFEAYVDPTCALYVPVLNVELKYRSLDGESTLTPRDNTNVRFAGDRLSVIGEADIYDPDAYLLTTREGYVYELIQGVGITTVTDPNGNTLTYTDNGIFHSDGKSVLFNRDGDGRITSITDPVGNLLTYTYDTEGDLISATDGLSNTTTYQYNQGDHYLTDILDPLGRTVVKNIYDDDGRLIAQEDSAGNRTVFNHDIAGRHSIVTDRLGNITQFYYDDRGNVTTQIDALGHSTTFTYDADDNQLSQTNALGHTTLATYNDRRDQLTQTDALGHSVSFSYNPRGQELTIADARGNTFTNTYDVVGNLLTIKDPLNNLAGQNIDAKGNVSLRRDALGNETTFTYDSAGNVLSETNPLGSTVTKTYDANGNVLTETHQRRVGGLLVEESTSYTYDANNRVTSTTDALGNTSYIEYDEMGNESARVDALGNRTEFVYDVYRRLQQTTYPDGTTETNTYDAEGNMRSRTDRLNRTTAYAYDALNRQTQVTYHDGSFTQTQYDALGRVMAEIDENGNRTEYGYDAAGRRTTVTDALGRITRFDYDVDGNLIQQTDSNMHVTEYEYDALDRRVRTIFDDVTEQTESYDALGRLTAKTDQAGKQTQYEYDALGRLTAVIDVLNQRTEYTYDEAGNKLTQKDAKGNITSWSYDGLGRVLTRILPQGQVETFSYDSNGNQTSHTDFNGETTTFEYDSNNRMTKKTYPDNSTETFTYDAMGNRLSATDSNGTTAYLYDSRDRLIKETQPNGNVLGYEYDSAGNRTAVITTVGTTVTRTNYTFDSLNRLASVTDENNQVTTYTYDPVGNRASVSYPNGNVTTYTYDSLNRLTYQETKDANNNIIASYDYVLQATGHRQQVTDHTGAVTTYSYDDLYRLIGETINDPVLGVVANDYTYDSVGNRTYATEDGVSTAYTYDSNDRLLTAGGETYSYDNNGNTLAVAIDNTLTSNQYDYNNRLVGMIKTVSGVEIDNVAYAYDIDGLRVAKNDDGIQTNYLVDKNRDYGQVLKELDSTNTETVSYLYGDDLIKQTRAANDAQGCANVAGAGCVGATDSYFIYDGHGSTRALSDDTGSITDTYDYSAYGQLIDQTGITENSYLYTGEQFDSNLDNYYLRARYYDQSNGRFRTMDAWMGRDNEPVTLNKYLYAHASPSNFTDPSGKFVGGLSGQAVALGIAATVATIATASYTSMLTRDISDYDPLVPDYKTAGMILLMGSIGYTTSVIQSAIDKEKYGDSGCILIFGPKAMGNGYSEVRYSCKPFTSWPIIRYIPSVVAHLAPKKAPCAPGYPADMMPVSISEGLKGWKECRYRN